MPKPADWLVAELEPEPRPPFQPIAPFCIECLLLGSPQRFRGPWSLLTAPGLLSHTAQLLLQNRSLPGNLSSHLSPNPSLTSCSSSSLPKSLHQLPSEQILLFLHWWKSYARHFWVSFWLTACESWCLFLSVGSSFHPRLFPGAL